MAKEGTNILQTVLSYSTLEELRESYKGCKRCPLHLTRKRICLGEGNKNNPPIMFVGESPGWNENTKGTPFVGDSGQVLDMLIADANQAGDFCLIPNMPEDIMSPDMRDSIRDVMYMTNSVMCYREDPKPTSSEIAACYKRLVNEIYLVDPVIIVAVGKIATSVLLHRGSSKTVSILKERGLVTTIQIPGMLGPVRYTVVAVLHPAFLLRVRDEDKPGGYFDNTKGDICLAMTIAGAMRLEMSDEEV